MESILTTFIGSDFQTVNSLLLEICRRMVHRRLWHLKTFVADHVTVQSCDITCHQLLDGMMWFLYYCCLGAFTSHFYPCGTVLAGTSYGFLFVCLCLSVTSQCSIKRDRQIELVFGTDPFIYLYHSDHQAVSTARSLRALLSATADTCTGGWRCSTLNVLPSLFLMLT